MSFGLVLSGGSAYGLANIGILDVFEKHNTQPNVIAGSSMGAIIAALFALGHDAKTISSLAEKLSPLSLIALSKTPFQGGMHGGILRQKLQEHLMPLIGNATIGETKIPFVCVAGKVKKPIEWSKVLTENFLPHIFDAIEPYIFPADTRILDALAASSALPVIFSPIVINGESFVDLCSFGAVPSRSLKKTHHVDVIIGTKTTPVFRSVKPYLPAHLTAFIEAAEESLGESLAVCDLVIEPELLGSLFDFHKSDVFTTSGRKAAEEMWPLIQKLLYLPTPSQQVLLQEQSTQTPEPTA